VGGTQSPPPPTGGSPPFTEFSGVVLSALATENLCMCACGGMSLSHSFSTPVPPSAFLVLLELGFSCLPGPQHCQKSVCARGWGGQPRASWGLWRVLSGAVVPLWEVEEKKAGSFLGLADKCGIYQPGL